MKVYVRGLFSAQRFLDRVGARFNRPAFLKEVGIYLAGDVKGRIDTQDQGRWKTTSKWIRAKKGIDKALVGTSKYIQVRLGNNRVQVIGAMPGNWKFTQHHRGFQNRLYSDKDKRTGRRITIDLVNPGALPWVHGNRFSWIAKRRGQTPARQIWTDQIEAEDDTRRIASRWLYKAVRDEGGVIL